jgi:hypothetical protein
MSKGKLVKVEITRLGYINHRRAYPGSIIDVPEEFYSASWMKKLDASNEKKKSVNPEKKEVVKVLDNDVI